MLDEEVVSFKSLDQLEMEFVTNPGIGTALSGYYSAIQATRSYERAELLLGKAHAHFPQDKSIAFKLIDALIQQNKNFQAISCIETAMARFGFDDGFLDAALQVRNLAGSAEPSATLPSLALCMIVKNEANHLPNCLESVKSLADEIIVVDTGSSDRTVDVATIFGAKVHRFVWNGSFADCRNYSLSKTDCDWILIMDADEVLSPGDHASVRRQIAQGREATAFSIRIRNYSNQVGLLGWQANDRSYPGEERGNGWCLSEMIRLFPNKAAIRFEHPVHESIQTSLSRLGIKISKGEGVVHHYGKLDQRKNSAKWEFYFELGKKKLLSEPASAEAVAELAIQAAELGKFEEAISLWEKVIAMRPGCAEAHLNLGCCFEMSGGRYGEALGQARRAMQLNSDLKEAIFNCAKYELYVGDKERSLQLIRDLLAREPEYPPAVVLFCVSLVVQERMAESWPLLVRLKELRFDCAASLAGHARTLGALGRKEYAARLDRAAAIIAGNPLVYPSCA